MNVNELINRYLRNETPRQSYPKYALASIPENYFVFITNIDDTSIYNQGIIYPEVTVNEVYTSMANDYIGNIALDRFSEMLSHHQIINCDDRISPLLLTKFSIFHEEGHWLYYLNNYRNCGVEDKYYMLDYEVANNEIGISYLKKSINIPGLSALHSHELVMRYSKLYRMHPFEKAADEYAIKRLIETQ